MKKSIISAALLLGLSARGQDTTLFNKSTSIGISQMLDNVYVQHEKALGEVITYGGSLTGYMKEHKGVSLRAFNRVYMGYDGNKKGTFMEFHLMYGLFKGFNSIGQGVGIGRRESVFGGYLEYGVNFNLLSGPKERPFDNLDWIRTTGYPLEIRLGFGM